MRSPRAAVLFLAAITAMPAACGRQRRPPAAPAPRAVSAGDAVWFEDAAGAAETGLELSLERAGFASVLIPMERLARSENGWSASREALPRSPFSRLPIALVIRADDSAAAVLASDDAQARRAFGDALALAARDALAGGSRAGRVESIVCDIPFSAAGADNLAEVLRRVRLDLPRGLLLTISLRFRPQQVGDHEKLRRLARRVDRIVAMLWGIGNAADPAATDALGVPWWAGYAPAVKGQARRAGAELPEPLPEEVFSEMTDDAHVEFRHDMIVPEEGFAYLLAPERRVSSEGFQFGRGDVLRFRQPSLADLVNRMGTDALHRRFLRGRTLALSGPPEAQRLFPLAAWRDLLAGRPLHPDLKVTLTAGAGWLEVSGENNSPHASAPSRTSNWIEIDLGSRLLRDVRTGGFDRYELFGPGGRPVTPARATRVRLYETLLQPFEKIQAARLLIRRSPPPDCCRYRTHVLAPTGNQIEKDWSR